MPKPNAASTKSSTKSSKSASSTATESKVDIATAGKVAALIFRRASPVLDETRGLEIVTEADLARAGTLFKQLQAWGAEIESKKEGILGPLRVAVNNIRALFRPAETRVEQAREYVAGKIADYHRAKQIEEQKERARLVKKGDTETVVSLAPSRIVTEDGAAVTLAKHREVVVVDAELIPREWLVPDMVAIRKAALAGKKIPGVEVREGVSVK